MSLESSIMMSRSWEMPNKNTFKMSSASSILKKYVTSGIWLDPFANVGHSNELCEAYVITNDIEEQYKTDYHLDALEFLMLFDNIDGVIFDPPYSVEQCLRLYIPKQNGTAGRAEYWAKCKDKISQVVKVGDKVISFAWDSVGVGKSRGFEIIEIKLICHGACHNDTIITIDEKKRHIGVI